MSAEKLRKAAALMREYAARGLAWDGDYGADKGWLPPTVALAVADWLDEEAASWDFTTWPQSEGALAVATAYLGGDA